MSTTRPTLGDGLRRFLAPLSGSWRPAIDTAAALALLLLWLSLGQRGFFASHLAGGVVPHAGPAEVEWWGCIYQFGAATVVFLLVPALLLKLVARERLSEIGLGLGDARFGFGVVVPLGLLLVALPGGLLAGTQPDFVAEYPMADLARAGLRNFLLYELAYGLLYYVPYETLFRGFLQLGLARRIGDASAILVQTAVTTLLHIGKPPGEIWSALLAGFLFGLVVARTRSVWPLVVVHWALGACTDFSCAWARGWGG
jgi:membrane protease YdiL (CAAX protease family)